MTAKEYLSQGRHLDARINDKLHQVEQLRLMAEKATAMLGGIPNSGTPNVSGLQDTICRIVDLEAEISRSVDQLIELRREMMHAIDAVPNAEYRTLLSMRYLSFRSWQDIADGMGYNEKYVYELHGKALKMIRVPQVLTKSGRI